MSFFLGLAHRLRVLWLGEDYAREQEREMQFHLELEGLAGEQESPGRRFGNVTYYREEARGLTPLAWLDRARQDLGYTLRSLRRTPGFTLAVVVTLGLGIGVNAAMFSVFDAMFLRMPGGVPAPHELRRLYIQTHSDEAADGRFTAAYFNYPGYRAVAAANPTIQLAAAGEPDSVVLETSGGTWPVGVSEVSGNYFDVLSLRPAIGRFFAPEESHVETPAFVAVISDALWRSRFAADPGVIGRRITLERRPFVIIGVAPHDFRGVDLDAVDVTRGVMTRGASFTLRCRGSSKKLRHARQVGGAGDLPERRRGRGDRRGSARLRHPG